MTKKKLEELAAQHIASNYAPTGTCSGLAVKINALNLELGERTRRLASGDCKNKTFSKNDCKREQEVFIPALQEASRKLSAAQKSSGCSSLKGTTSMSLPKQLAEDLATTAIDAATAVNAAEQNKQNRNYMIIGGVAVVALVVVYLIGKRKA